MTYSVDTSALLNGAYDTLKDEDLYISPLVISELENIKTNSSNETLKMQARQVVNFLLERADKCNFLRRPKVEKLLEVNDFLPNTNDSRILIEACLTASTFLTSDGAQYLLAKQLEKKYPNFSVELFKPAEPKKPWRGWNEYHPDEITMSRLYSDPEINSLNAKPNEFCKIFEDEELKDILFWTGEKYRSLNYKSFKTALGEKLGPRNTEQKMAFDLLQNGNIPVKLLTGVYGSGKDYIMLNHALDAIKKGEKDRIIFIRQASYVKDTVDIGALPGTEQEKLLWTLRPVQDIIGIDLLDTYLASGQIENINLGFCRGASFKNSIVYVTEGQNLTSSHVKLILSRLGENSQLFINGDYHQTDRTIYEKDNGIATLKAKLAGNPFFGCVHLKKTERGAISELANLLD